MGTGGARIAHWPRAFYASAGSHSGMVKRGNQLNTAYQIASDPAPASTGKAIRQNFCVRHHAGRS